jgi:hypothetical protein
MIKFVGRSGIVYDTSMTEEGAAMVAERFPHLHLFQSDQVMLMTQSENATYQALRSRGVGRSEAYSAALDGVTVDEVRAVDQIHP